MTLPETRAAGASFTWRTGTILHSRLAFASRLLITTIFPRIYTRTYYAHPRARVMSFSAFASRLLRGTRHNSDLIRGPVHVCAVSSSTETGSKTKVSVCAKNPLHPRSSPSHPDAHIELPCARCNRISEALVEASRNSRVGRVLHATSGFVTVGHFRHLLIVAFADAKQYKFAQFALLC